MLATARDPFPPSRSGAIRPRGGEAVRSSGLVGRDALVWRIRVLVAEARGPICLSGPAGSGSTAIAAAVADKLARQTRVLGLRCLPETTFARLTEILAEGLDGGDVSGTVSIVLTDVGAVSEPGFLRALAHLAAELPQFGWLIAGAPQAMPGARSVAVPLLAESETAAAVDAAVERHAAVISKIGRSTAATLCRGLPGLADRLVAEAWTAVGTAGDDGIGLPHLRTAARALVGPEVAADAPALLRAAARTPIDPDGTFPRAALAIAPERAGAATDRGVAPERDPALVAAGRVRLRFSDDAAAARLLLSEFGWTFHRG
ncbi:hypothetical protein [Methylobacterium sp. J-092]|nr:hypothetical protein [Methylobacterium sp. J-092]MCJ2005724.1 hypothetical protein [Methylobacterium sp. J-092]